LPGDPVPTPYPLATTSAPDQRHARDDLGAHATVLLVLADEVDRKRGKVKLDAVVDNVVRERFREDLAHVHHSRVSEAKEIESAGCPVWRAGPECEERRAFGHELLGMSRGREAEQ
jgi:hypothetical protein